MTPEQTKHLWRLLGQTWGSRFLETYGAEPNEAWSAALDSLSVVQAKYGLSQLIRAGGPHPPSLPEFMLAARKYREQITPERLLPNHVPPEKAAENIRRLREAMKDLH